MNNANSTSIIDHFLYSPGLSPVIKDAGVIYSFENKSDHIPIYCILSDLCVPLDTAEPSRQEPRPSWSSASVHEKEQNKINLEDGLSQINVPQVVVSCKDVKCRNAEHCELVDKLTCDVLQVIQLAAEDALPCPVSQGGVENKNIIPGWNDTVKLFKDTAYFWHQVLRSCGWPINTEVHRIMKRTRNIYHYQVSRCKKAKEINQKRNSLMPVSVVTVVISSVKLSQ